MSKASWICAAVAVGIIAALFAVNGYVSDVTHGCYNAFTIMFA